MKKFNFVDIIILFVVAVIAITGAVTVVSLRDKKVSSGLINNKTESTITYDILFEGVEGYLVDALKDVTEVYGVDANENIGEVVDVKVEPFEKTIVSSNTGKVLKREVPEHYNIYVTLKSKGKVLSNGMFTIGDAELFPTKLMSVKGKHFYARAKIWNVLEVE